MTHSSDQNQPPPYNPNWINNPQFEGQYPSNTSGSNASENQSSTQDDNQNYASSHQTYYPDYTSVNNGYTGNLYGNYKASISSPYYSYGFPSPTTGVDGPMPPPISNSPIPQGNVQSQPPSSLQNHRMGRDPVYYHSNASNVQSSRVAREQFNPDPPGNGYMDILKAHITPQNPKTKHPSFFLFKVYAILLVQIAITGALVAANFYIRIPQNYFFMVFFGSFFISIILLLVLFCVRKVRFLNLIVLGQFTLFFGWCIGVISAQYNLLFVLQAIIVTFCVTFFISFLVIITKAKLMWMGNLLCTLLCVLIFAALFGSLFSFVLGLAPWWHMLISGFAAILFSLFIAYDTSMIIYRYEDNEAIIAAVNLYLDIANLFLAILALTGLFAGRR